MQPHPHAWARRATATCAMVACALMADVGWAQGQPRTSGQGRPPPVSGQVKIERAQPPGQEVSSAREVPVPKDWQEGSPVTEEAPAAGRREAPSVPTNAARMDGAGAVVPTVASPAAKPSAKPATQTQAEPTAKSVKTTAKAPTSQKTAQVTTAHRHAASARHPDVAATSGRARGHGHPPGKAAATQPRVSTAPHQATANASAKASATAHAQHRTAASRHPAAGAADHAQGRTGTRARQAQSKAAKPSAKATATRGADHNQAATPSHKPRHAAQRAKATKTRWPASTRAHPSRRRLT